MTAATSLRAVLDRQTTERDLQAEILKLAKLTGWMAYHTFDSRHSPEGFPDLTLAHPDGCLMFLEVKTEKGKTTPAQDRWIDVLQGIGGRVQAMVARPSDWELIVQELTVRPA